KNNEGGKKKSKIAPQLSSPTKTDLEKLPLIEVRHLADIAIGFKEHRLQWEQFEYLEDSVLEHCLSKIARGRYLLDYSVEVIQWAVTAMATNKILAAYAVTLGLPKLNNMRFQTIKKLHADSFEAYIRAYYLFCREKPTCIYLYKLMVPLFDLFIREATAYNLNHLYNIAAGYFSMLWIGEEGRLYDE
ncbi:1724_t:CDS:2, partial [Dentiscutata erythropus]